MFVSRASEFEFAVPVAEVFEFGRHIGTVELFGRLATDLDVDPELLSGEVKARAPLRVMANWPSLLPARRVELPEREKPMGM